MQIDASPLLGVGPLAQTLASLVQIESVNPSYGGPAGGERRVLERAARFLEEAGLRPRLVDALEGRPNLRVRLEGEQPGPPILFETHIDTVSVTGMTIDPFAGRVEQNRLWGRGSVDAKGQAAALLHALAAWAAADRRPPRAIELALVVDEEFGFGGARALARDGIEAAAIVIAEPTELRVVCAHKGSVRIAIDFAGRAAHAAKPHLGINAISAAAAFIRELDETYKPLLASRRDALLGAPTINSSLIEGGVQINLVPPACRLQLDRRTIPGEGWPAVRAEIEELFARAAQRFEGFSATIEEPLLDAPPLRTEPDHPLVEAAGQIAAGLGRPAEPIGVDYATDGCALAATGCPIIITGPGSIDQAHTADEFIELDELVAGARYFARLMGNEFSRLAPAGGSSAAAGPR